MIGIMSDSHDNLDAIRKAVSVFNEAGVELVIHAGDLIAPFTAREFKELKSEFLAIFGNNDGERDLLRHAYKDMCHLEDFKEIEVQNKKIAVIHGTVEAIVDALVLSKKYDIIIRGHNHRQEVVMGESLLVNPGETCGYVSGKKTVMLLDPDDLSFETIVL